MGRVLTVTAARGAGGLPAPPPGLTVILVLLLGSWGLLAGHFSPPTAGRPTAVIIPPWRPAGFAFAGEVGLPPLDIRWGGRLVVFPATDDPLALSRMGPFAMPADGSRGCFAQPSDRGV